MAQRRSQNLPHRLCVNNIPSEAHQSPVLGKFLINLFGRLNLPLNILPLSARKLEITHILQIIYSEEKYPPSPRHLVRNQSSRSCSKRSALLKRSIQTCRLGSLSSLMVAFIPAFLRVPYWLRVLPTTSGLLLADLCLLFRLLFEVPWLRQSLHLTNAKRY